MYPENNRTILFHEFFSFETELQQLLIGSVLKRVKITSIKYTTFEESYTRLKFYLQTEIKFPYAPN